MAAKKKKVVKKRVVRSKPIEAPPKVYDKAWLSRIKRDRFVAAYVRTSNASQAAREAGYIGKNPGMAGHELLKNPDVADAVETMRQAVRARCVYDLEKVHNELCLIAFADMHDFAEWNEGESKLRDSKTLAPDLTRAVAEVQCEEKPEKRTVKIKLSDKQAALDKLCRLQGWYAAKKRDVTVSADAEGRPIFKFTLADDD